MKKTTFSVLAAFAVAGSAFAGTAKESKAVVTTTPFFQDTEIALDAFYSFNDGSNKGPKLCDSNPRCVLQPQYFTDGSGGGVGVNFFFARYFGVGVEGNWWDGANSGITEAQHDLLVEKDRVDSRGRVIADYHKSVAHQFTGNLLLRYPIEFTSFGVAPYVLGGGGLISDGKNSGFYDVGAGVELRLTPHWGVFSDWRWNFVQGSDRNDVNTTRAGVRFVF